MILVRTPERFDSSRGTVKTWLFGIARNLVLKQYRDHHAEEPWKCRSGSGYSEIPIAPGKWRFLVSVAPHEGYHFRKAGTIKRNHIEFDLDGSRYEAGMLMFYLTRHTSQRKKAPNLVEQTG